MPFNVVQRQAARAIVLTPEWDVLLMRIRAPQGGDPFWITPGGGLEQDETMEEALRRELREELGLERCEIGPLVWRRQHTFSWGAERVCQREEFRVVHADRFDPRMSDVIEARVLEQFRWWSVDELPLASERLTPLSLPDIVARYREHGEPREPLELEVVVD